MAKTQKFRQNFIDDEDDLFVKRGKKKDNPRRRPVRNWKRQWLNNATSAEDHDEFYGQ